MLNAEFSASLFYGVYFAKNCSRNSKNTIFRAKKNVKNEIFSIEIKKID